nr:hypothetical protein CFP56_31413 [Quercus suber]
MGLDIGLVEVPVHPIRWAFALIASLLAMPMGLLAVIYAIAYPPQHEGCELLGLHYFFMGLDIGLVEVPVHPIRWAFALIASLLAMPMGLLAVIYAT